MPKAHGADMTDVSTPDEATPAPSHYTVNRAQDGAVVRAELSLEDAKSECLDLNVQARQQVGLTEPVRDQRGDMLHPARPIFGSMYHGEIARYEVWSADGLVIG